MATIAPIDELTIRQDFVSRTFPAVPTTPRNVRAMLSEFAGKVGLPPNVLVDVTLAATEACANVIKHAYPDQSVGIMDVIADTDATYIRVVVRDYGVGIDRCGGSRGVGMGLKIIEALAALHSVDPCEPGTRTAMTFSLRQRVTPSV